MRGFIVGVLLLTGLQAVVSKSGSGRVGEAFTGLAAVIRHVTSPEVPAIPDLRQAGGDWGGPTVAPSSTTTTPAPAAPAVLPAPVPTRPSVPTINA